MTRKQEEMLRDEAKGWLIAAQWMRKRTEKKIQIEDFYQPIEENPAITFDMIPDNSLNNPHPFFVHIFLIYFVSIIT